MELELLLLLACCLVAGIAAQCNVCNSVNSMACYSRNQTQSCDANNLPSYVPYDCPAGYVCVSGAGGVLCEPEASASATVACQQCNKCDANGTFACTGSSSFALCDGTGGTPQVSAGGGSCASGYVCNINYAGICGSNATVAPSCSYADDTTTTTTTTSTTTTSTTTSTAAASTTPATPSTSNAASYCAAVQSAGRYAVGDYTETTCRQYIECFLLNGNWLGHTYTCPGSTYFSRSTRNCVTTLPSTCY
ncbi:hypothetical protein KR222_011438, partial [Zaprionus bogoriensis]